MKNLITIILCTLITINANSQKKWSFGIDLFPNYTMGSIFGGGSQFNGIDKKIKFFEIGKFYLNRQLYTSYSINSKSSISVGVGFHITGEQTRTMIFIPGNTDPDKGFVATDPNDPFIPLKSKFVYDHYNIQIPVLYRKDFSKKFYFRTGLNTILNLHNTVTHIYTTQSGEDIKRTREETSTRFRNLNFSGQLGIGYNIFKTNFLNPYVQPTIEFSFLGVSKNALLNRNPLSLGIVIGARF
jgi:hypothetical protein